LHATSTRIRRGSSQGAQALEEEDRFELLAGEEGLEAGDEVTIRYGTHVNALFLLMYGFTPRDNAFERAVLFDSASELVGFFKMLLSESVRLSSSTRQSKGREPRSRNDGREDGCPSPGSSGVAALSGVARQAPSAPPPPASSLVQFLWRGESRTPLLPGAATREPLSRISHSDDCLLACISLMPLSVSSLVSHTIATPLYS
jgi:hypothetical protein